MKRKALLIYFEPEEMEIYIKIKEKAEKDKRTIPNTAKLTLKEALKIKG